MNFDSVYERLKTLRKDVSHFVDHSQNELLRKKILKAYLKSPPKIQYVLSRFFVKSVLNKHQSEMEEPMRH